MVNMDNLNNMDTNNVHPLNDGYGYDPGILNPQDVNSDNGYNGTVVHTSLVFIDTVFYLFCMFSVLPSISRCLYMQYKYRTRPPDTVNPIDNLQSLIITNNIPEDVCTICLEEFNFDEELIKLKCNHIFHKECLKPWLDNKKKCPICRENIV